MSMSAGPEPISGIPAIGSSRIVGAPWKDDQLQGVTPLAPVRLPGVVPPVTTPATPADGMNPADDAVLQQVQRLLDTSLTLAGGTEDVAGRLRAALVQAQPALFAKLPGSMVSQTEQLAQALTWLVQNLDRPPVMVAGCGLLGAALAECGVMPQHLQLVGAALAEAMRAGMANAWRQDFDDAWRSTWQHAQEWITHGMAAPGYQPTVWAATVVSHERRRDDLAVIRLRPYLPLPFLPGQYARFEVNELPGIWRPYSLAGAPRRDNIIELHVRAKNDSGVSGTLVYRTGVGDIVRISRAEGQMVLPESGRDLLMIAGDTGVAPLKALLTELAATGDPRSAVLFWGVRNLAELYDIEEVAALARAAQRATVVPVISEGEAGPYASGLVTDAVAAYGEWSGHEAYLAGPPIMLAATTAALLDLGMAPERIHHDLPE
jgi:NAD(P)H-flavin reductase/hemoglobin-like flavoprotein